ncbi:type VII secretion EssA family protein [Psychrobacillus sp. FSL K6-2836]|uniref:type VII secretion EssA family protein n=1 Tax=Psychrobacillus sp. FSL K6-2836 TaxID=2921548 RepID=UPI0030FCEA73
MKRMKVNPRLLFPILFLTLVGNGFVVLAEEPKKVEDLDPVIYEKLEFKKNTDYLHDKKKTEMKNTIPKKQVDIYFDGRKKLPNRGDTSYLFQTAERGEKSTVTAKSSELKLFSEKDITLADVSVSQIEEESASNSARTILFFGVIGIGILTLFVIFLPRLVSTSESTESAK